MQFREVPHPSSAIASLALLVFAGLGFGGLSFVLVASLELATWRLVLTSVTSVVALVASVFVWLNPTKAMLWAGMVAMVLSIARLGLPGDWTASGLLLAAITALLVMPQVHALMVLRS